MKKLMIAAAIVCAAAMSHGAQWVWNTAPGANFVDDTGALKESGTFVLMYLGNGQEADWSMASAANVKNTAALDYQNPLPGIIPAYNSVAGAYDLTVGTDQNGQWFAVMFKDGDEYKQLLDATSGDALAAKQLSGFADASSTVADFTFASANYTVAAVPEPTSGLLLLLGVAGLAIRRRRA